MTRRPTYFLLSAFLAFSFAPAARAQTPVEGQKEFNNACRTCHSVKDGDNRLGPHLYKIVGRKAGSVQKFGYSPSLSGAEFVWDEKTLDQFIADPNQVAPGNNMKPFTGISSAQDRAKIIGFLKAKSS